MNETKQDYKNKVSPLGSTTSRARSTTLFGAAVLAMAVAGGGFYAMHDNDAIRESGLEESEDDQGLPPSSMGANDYRKWDRPLVALVLSGQMHGYTMPCGCSFPQYGGLVRRYNFIDSLKTGSKGKAAWDVVGIDLGEMAQLQGIREQNLLKFDLTMKALSTMNYRAVGIGKNELLAPIGPALALTYDKKRPNPHLISLTLAETGPGQYFHDLNVRPYEIVANVEPKIGIISMMGPDFRALDELKNSEKFLNNQDELPKALKAFAEAGVEMGIILHHEYPKVDDKVQGIALMKALEQKRKKFAAMVAEFCTAERKRNPKIPQIQLMMVLTKEPEPPAVMQSLDPKLPTQVVEIGHKGKYVGLVGVYRDGGSYRFQYQIVLMGPEWDTPKGKEDKNPVVALMQRYADEVKRQDLMAQAPRSPHYIQLEGQNGQGLRANFVGSERCGDCHAHAYDVWSGKFANNPKLWHNVATATLEHEKFPSGRQFDPECIVCHSVGFKYPGGYNDPIDIAQWPKKGALLVGANGLAKHNAKLSGVGCESCHGPGSLHAKNPDNKEVRKLMNPYAPSKEERAFEAALKKDPTDTKTKTAFNQLFQRRMGNLEQFCVKCHDHENDVHWGQKEDGFDYTVFAKWAKVTHRTPAAGNNNGNPPANGKAPPVERKLDVNRTDDAPIPEIRIEVEVEKKN